MLRNLRIYNLITCMLSLFSLLWLEIIDSRGHVIKTWHENFDSKDKQSSSLL